VVRHTLSHIAVARAFVRRRRTKGAGSLTTTVSYRIEDKALKGEVDTSK
jgi:hypothetical protein